jgi:hypothetical protein
MCEIVLVKKLLTTRMMRTIDHSGADNAPMTTKHNEILLKIITIEIRRLDPRLNRMTIEFVFDSFILSIPGFGPTIPLLPSTVGIT